MIHLKQFAKKYEHDIPIYIVGNASLKFQGIIKKSNKDIDIILDKRIEVGDLYFGGLKVDLIGYEHAFIAPDYKDRALMLEKDIYAVSLEDIIVNKVSGYSMERHSKDIAEYMKLANKELVKDCFDKASSRKYNISRDWIFKTNAELFEKDYL